MTCSPTWRRTVSSVRDHPGDAVIAGRALVAGALTPILLLLPLARLAWALEPHRIALRRARNDHRAADAADIQTTVEHVLDVIDAVHRRTRLVVRPSCRTRGLTRYCVLRRAGIDVTLAFGTGRVDDEIAAHCWVELDGRPLREPSGDSPFRPLFRIRAPGVVAIAS